MAKVDCWHPSDDLSLGRSTKNGITKIICGRCNDHWTVVKDDVLISWVERGAAGGYVRSRLDGPSSTTSQTYTPDEWETANG